jgi:hypothetical protein
LRFRIVGPAKLRYGMLKGTFSEEVVTFLEATGLKPKRTRGQARRQNGVAESWIGRAGRHRFDHVMH